MRLALTLKSSNASSQSNVPKNAPPVGGGKLTRQVGTSNLRQKMLPELATPVVEPVIKTNVKENFDVFEDPVVESGESSSSDQGNNLIHFLERKMEEKIREEEEEKIKDAHELNKFMKTRDNIETMSVCSEAPSERMSVTANYDDDDFDKASVASSTFTTIRASFSSINFERQQKDEMAARAASIKKRADKEERENFMQTSEEYFCDIYRYMAAREMTNRASSKYMLKQAEVDKDMREILIDWFHDVIKEYFLQKETFHLAVSIVDRVMSFLSVDKIQLQLVGTTALMIAAKYEEIFPPETPEYAVITDHTYRVSDILKMERYLLNQLNFVVSTPTAAWFGTCFAKRMVYPMIMTKTLDYLLDLSLIDIGFLAFKPSLIAAAACCFTNVQHEMDTWPEKMAKDTGISTDDFLEIVRELHRLYICASTNNNKSIYNKYCEPEEKSVATMPAPTATLRKLFPTIFERRRPSGNV